jgi:hypothetical protein
LIQTLLNISELGEILQIDMMISQRIRALELPDLVVLRCNKREHDCTEHGYCKLSNVCGQRADLNVNVWQRPIGPVHIKQCQLQNLQNDA